MMHEIGRDEVVLYSLRLWWNGIPFERCQQNLGLLATSRNFGTCEEKAKVEVWCVDWSHHWGLVPAGSTRDKPFVPKHFRTICNALVTHVSAKWNTLSDFENIVSQFLNEWMQNKCIGRREFVIWPDKVTKLNAARRFFLQLREDYAGKIAQLRTLQLHQWQTLCLWTPGESSKSFRLVSKK